MSPRLDSSKEAWGPDRSHAPDCPYRLGGECTCPKSNYVEDEGDEDEYDEDEDDEDMNDNVLAGMRCPRCKSTEPFTIVGVAAFEVWDSGTDTFQDTEWDDDSPCSCPCGFHGTVGDFRKPLWDNDEVQFARLLDELLAVGVVNLLGEAEWQALEESTDLKRGEIMEIFGRAQARWDRAKTELLQKPEETEDEDQNLDDRDHQG